MRGDEGLAAFKVRVHPGAIEGKRLGLAGTGPQWKPVGPLGTEGPARTTQRGAPAMSTPRSERQSPAAAKSPNAPDLPWQDRAASAKAHRASMARQASGRRRLIDPATCEREYSDEEIEFMQAMQEYKQKSGRMFPTWSEVLEVLRDLGYAKSFEAALASASVLLLATASFC